MEAWDFNRSESRDKIVESDEKKDVFDSRNYLGEKMNCVTGSMQLKMFSQMDGKLLIKW